VVQPPGQTGPPEIGKPCCSRQIGEISWKPKKLGYGNKHPKGPLSDKVFGLSLQKVQEEVNKTPQPLRVNVQLTNGKRSASVSSSAPTGVDKRRKMFVPKASGPKKPHQKGGFKGAKKPGKEPKVLGFS
jgi:hypothetical protein